MVSDLVASIEERLRLPEVSLPNYDIAPDDHDDDVEEAAAALRDEWQLGTGPIPNVVLEVERHGVPVARLAFGLDAVDAFSVRFVRRPVVLLTTNKSNYVRSRFDCAHELAHLIGHRRYVARTVHAERQAHTFASAFLLPKDVAVEMLPRRLDANGWRQLAALKSEWGLSMSALIQRARRLDILDTDAFTSARRFMAVRGWHREEPGDREMGPPESPVLIDRALRTFEAERQVSATEFVRAASLPVDDVFQLVAASADRRPIVNF